MRKFWKNNRHIVIFISLAIVLWRGALWLIENRALDYIPKRHLFLGPIPWANFDGVHYIAIAGGGYGLFQESFFPLFPLLLRFFAQIFGGNYLVGALFLVHVSLFFFLFFLWKLITIDFSNNVARWAIVFLGVFPTSFFLGSIYTESLFLALVVGSYYAARKRHWFISSFLAALASATRLVGIFLLPALLYEWWLCSKEKKNLIWLGIIPFGLFAYMIFLYFTGHDFLAFIHSQPAFGANRSGGELILLPQVIYRYIKILTTVSWLEYDFRIAFLELLLFNFVLVILMFTANKMRKSYLVFSFLALLGPTLSGTLSSIPRYVLVVFPFFIMLGTIRNTSLKILLVFSFCLLFIILTMLFVKGYFVA